MKRGPGDGIKRGAVIGISKLMGKKNRSLK